MCAGGNDDHKMTIDEAKSIYHDTIIKNFLYNKKILEESPRIVSDVISAYTELEQDPYFNDLCQKGIELKAEFETIESYGPKRARVKKYIGFQEGKDIAIAEGKDAFSVNAQVGLSSFFKP